MNRASPNRSSEDATTCPNCGAAVAPDARFCATCGTSLEPIQPGAEERKLARLALERGDPEGAGQLLRSALARFDELRIPFEAARTRELLADLVDEPERTSLLRNASAAYEQLGARPFAERARSGLGDTLESDRQV